MGDIIFTNGVFDIIHKGHIHLLKMTKMLGDCRGNPAKIVVGLNSDESTKKIKGSDRPINNQDSRRAVLQAIKYVDQVIIFDEDNPWNLIVKIKPRVIVKGGDYKIREVVGFGLCPIVIIPTIEDYSTTNIIKRIGEING